MRNKSGNVRAKVVETDLRLPAAPGCQRPPLSIWSLNGVSRSRPHAPRARALPPRCSPGCPAAPGPAPPHPSRRTPFGPRSSQRCPLQKAGRACNHASRFHSNQDDAAQRTTLFSQDTGQQHRVLLAAAVGARCIVGVVVWYSGAVSGWGRGSHTLVKMDGGSNRY